VLEKAVVFVLQDRLYIITIIFSREVLHEVRPGFLRGLLRPNLAIKSFLDILSISFWKIVYSVYKENITHPVKIVGYLNHAA
jgi:hypothetical protein